MNFKKIPTFRPSISFFDIIRTFLYFISSNLFFSNTKKGNCRSRFEKKFSNYIGSNVGISTTSARMAIFLLLKNLKLEKGNEVLVPSFTYPAVIGAIKAAGLIPVFVDIIPETYQLDPAILEEKIGPKTKVIIPTHLYGFPERLNKIFKFCKENGLIIIEDCAQSCGAHFMDRKVGGFGKASYFSFSITKNITTLGGGMVVTDDVELGNRIRKFMDENMRYPSNMKILKRLIKISIMKFFTSSPIFNIFFYPLIAAFFSLGIDIVDILGAESIEDMKNFKGTKGNIILNDIQSFLGIRQLKKLDSQNKKRIQNGKFMLKKLNNLTGIKGLVLPRIDRENIPIYLSFPLQTKKRNMFAELLRKEGVDVTLGYIRNCSNLFNSKDSLQENNPGAEKAEKEIFHIPLYPSLHIEDIKFMIKKIKQIVEYNSIMV